MEHTDRLLSCTFMEDRAKKCGIHSPVTSLKSLRYLNLHKVNTTEQPKGSTVLIRVFPPSQGVILDIDC